MHQMKVHWGSLSVSLKVGPDIRDVTQQLEVVLSRSGIENGVLHAFVVD